ncbi:hypothetical protein [Pseudomonas sp. CGJS7]|uniref:hypothetical protein n=1 Tax=Pseudomonas sp. CGJS7 TaxID=3109348 RepID=UPI003009C170
MVRIAPSPRSWLPVLGATAAVVSISIALTACSAQSVDRQTQARSVDICKRLVSIKSVPFNESWPTDDSDYLALKERKSEAAVCLLDRIVDNTPMQDPRSEPTKANGFVVGDLALFLLSDFKIVPFESVLPGEVKAQLPTRGVLAYFAWVQQPGNRQRLQAAAKEWVRMHPAPRR